MDYCLIEDWKPDCILPKKSQAVALTEKAIFRLEHCGIPYITLEEFYTSYEIRGDVDKFLLDQVAWFDDFDALLKEIFPKAAMMNVNLATIYFYPIKRAVDNAILTTRILRKFIESAQPKKIWYVGCTYEAAKTGNLLDSNHFEDHLLDPDFKMGENPYFLLIEPLCSSYGITFERIRFKSLQEPDKEAVASRNKKISLNKDCIKRLALRFLPISEFRSLYICARSILARQGKGRILLLHNSGLMEDFCIKVRKYGFEIFIKGNTSAKRLSWQLWRKPLSIGRAQSVPQCDREDMFKRILNSHLMEWIKGHCGLDVSGLLRSRFTYFLQKFCPETLVRICAYIEFYNKNNIDFVVTPNIWTIDDHAAIAAARLSSSTKSIGFAHGADVYECKSRFFFVNRHYDFFFSPSSHDTEHERWLLRQFNYEYPKVYEFPYFQKRISKRYKRNKSPKLLSFSGNRRVVLFVPIIYGTPPGRSLQLNQPFPMEYVKWHRALADYFSTRKDIFFIWKGLIQPEQRFDLMSEIIRKKSYDNIVFNSSRLIRWFPFAERALLDIPSTAFFECIYSNMPVMALYRPRYQILRKSAYDSFGPSLRAYNNVDEGLGLVKEFLDSQSQKYLVPVSEPGQFTHDILETNLTRIRQDSRKNKESYDGNYYEREADRGSKRLVE